MAPENKHQYFSLSGARELGILIYILALYNIWAGQ